MQIKTRVLTLWLVVPIIVLSVIVLHEALKIKPPANVYPVVIMLAVIVLAAIAGITSLTTERGSRDLPISVGGPTIWMTIAATVMYAFILQFDYLIATSLFMLLLILKFDTKPLTLFGFGKCVFISGVVTGFVYVSFVSWLGVDVPSWW